MPPPDRLESVEVKEGTNPEVYVAFSPRFERIWLESKKRLPEYMAKKPATFAGVGELPATGAQRRDCAG
jgi:hypothetical protein